MGASQFFEAVYSYKLISGNAYIQAVSDVATMNFYNNGILGLSLGSTGLPTFPLLTTAGYTKNSSAGLLSTQAVPIPIADGGTNATTATTAFNNLSPMTTQGDIIQGGASGAGQRLAAVATGNALISGGVGALNSWGKIGLTTHVTGLLPSANINWADINGLSPINTGGVNWINISNYATGKVLTATSANGVNWSSPITGTNACKDFKCINVDPNASTAVWGKEWLPYNVTWTAWYCWVDASTSAVITPKECNANMGSCGNITNAITCGTTKTTGTITDSSYAANNGISVTVGTISGSPTQVLLCGEFTKC